MAPSRSVTALASQIAAALTEPVPANQAATAITKAAVELLPGVGCASICSRVGSEALDSVAPTDPLAAEADRLQQQLGEGPALYAMTTASRVDAPNVSADWRWPLYGPKLAASGLEAQLVLPLHMSATRCAVLNLYAASCDGLDRVGLAGDLFASHAAVAWCGTVQLHEVGEALERRKLIGQALGVVMERYGVTEEAAFRFLTRTSQSGNVKLREVARQVVSAVGDRNRSGS